MSMRIRPIVMETTSDLVSAFSEHPVPPALFRERIERLEAAIVAGIQGGRVEDWADRETTASLFADRDERFGCHMGVRIASAPAGSVIIGKVHRYPHVVFVMQGKAIVATENGSRQVVAPDLMVCKAETKRAIIVLEDATWASVHMTGEATLASLEEVVASKFAELEDRT